MRRGRPWSLAAGYRLWMLPPGGIHGAVLHLAAGSCRGDQPDRHSGKQVPGLSRIVRRRGFSIVLGYTLRIALLVTLATSLLGYPVAWAVTTLRGRWRSLALGLILLPFWTSAVIRSYAWLVIFQRRGPFNQALLATGLIDAPLRPLKAASHGCRHGPHHAAIHAAAAAQRDVAHRSDCAPRRIGVGAKPWRQFVHVYLPQSLPGIAAGSVLVFITSLGSTSRQRCLAATAP